jgi:hypothetical protein
LVYVALILARLVTPMAISETLLPLGRIVATPGALEALARAGQEAKLFLERHASGDWGQVDEHDRAQNDYNLAHGSRILSSYRRAAGASLWIITTCLLLPEDY